MAEAVEKVRATRIFATIVYGSRPLCNIDSITGFALNHCFKNSEPRDFFNNLG